MSTAAGVYPEASSKREQDREGDILERDWPAAHTDENDFEQQSRKENAEESKKRPLHRLSKNLPVSKAHETPRRERGELKE